jgi:DNA-directed RNA polymerase specialized sigma24 family protein
LSDHSEADASRALGVSQNTLKRHLARARTALRDHLADWDEQE